jgi:hypothetical protein
MPVKPETEDENNQELQVPDASSKVRPPFEKCVSFASNVLNSLFKPNSGHEDEKNPKPES